MKTKKRKRIKPQNTCKRKILDPKQAGHEPKTALILITGEVAKLEEELPFFTVGKENLNRTAKLSFGPKTSYLKFLIASVKK